MSNKSNGRKPRTQNDMIPINEIPFFGSPSDQEQSNTPSMEIPILNHKHQTPSALIQSSLPPANENSLLLLSEQDSKLVLACYDEAVLQIHEFFSFADPGARLRLLHKWWKYLGQKCTFDDLCIECKRERISQSLSD